MNQIAHMHDNDTACVACYTNDYGHDYDRDYQCEHGKRRAYARTFDDGNLYENACDYYDDN